MQSEKKTAAFGGQENISVQGGSDRNSAEGKVTVLETGKVHICQ